MTERAGRYRVVTVVPYWGREARREVMTDQTARILAEHGTPRQRCEYALHCAQDRYRRGRQSADTAFAASGEDPRAFGPAWQALSDAITAAWQAQRREYARALLAYDSERDGSEECDGYTIGSARESLAPMPAFLAECLTG